MLDKYSKIERRFLELENELSRPETQANPAFFRKLSKERSDLIEPVELLRSYRESERELLGATQVRDESSDSDLVALAREEIACLSQKLSELEKTLRISLLPKDPYESRDVILEIRAGAGGDEASLFVAEVFKMYARFCDKQRWKFELMSCSENELGGFKEVIASVQGQKVYATLKHESGVHRVQRVPQTEAQGRVHTSTITVAVLPEADDVEVEVNESDLRVDTFRAGGAGGQHVNRTDSAVRITHIPSGIVVVCQDERSQIKNRAKALKILKTRLLDKAKEEHEKAISEDRRSQVGKADRSERIRTYNFPQSRVTDHRINHTTHAINEVMQGDIEQFVLLLQKAEQDALMAQQESYEGSL